MQYILHQYNVQWHYDDVIMSTMASEITSHTIVCSNVYSGADQRKHQSSASLAFVWGNHRWPVNSPHKWPVTRKMFPFDDVIMKRNSCIWRSRFQCNPCNQNVCWNGSVVLTKFRRWLHWKLSKWQLTKYSVTKISLKGRHFRSVLFIVTLQLSILCSK